MADSSLSIASTGTIADKVNASANRLADAQQTFLKLLTTQLKNQDPLSPLDSNQFTQQIVQMTGVEQQLYSNQLLEQLVAGGGAGLSGSVGLIGKTVAVKGDTNPLGLGQASYAYYLAPPPANTNLVIDNWAGLAALTR